MRRIGDGCRGHFRGDGSGDNDNPDGAVPRLDPTEYFRSVHARHEEVKKDAVGSEAVQFLKSSWSIRGRVNEIAVRLQTVLQDLSNVRIIIDHEDVWCVV